MSFWTDFLKNLIFGRQISGKTKRFINSALVKASESLKSKDSHLMKASITQLDSMLGMALNDLYGKNSIAENLKKAKNKFSKEVYQKVWEAHKIRNHIVHEPERYLGDRELDSAVRNFILVLNRIKN